MRFTCDACKAQYMISDEKVGPNGVKVRCKKCGHIILVKRAPEAPAAVAPPPEPSAPVGGDGLDVELGQAFDKVLGGTPPASGAAAGPPAEPSAPPPGGGAPPAGDAAPDEPGDGWHVAIDDQQVGPLAAPAVKEKWESGEIGPDTLVWKAGLEDWRPLSQVPELQRFLSPLTRRPRQQAARPPPPPAAPAPSAAEAKEPDWKPTAASALAALASEEMAAMKEPEPAKPAPAAARPGGKGSLVDSMNLPDSGGVDPTGAIPLPIKGMEITSESRLERKSSVARTTAELRIKRSANRTILMVALAMLVLVVAGVGGVFLYFKDKIGFPTAAPPSPAVPAPVTAAAPPAAAPPAAAPAPAPARAAPPAAPPQAAAPAPAEPPAAPQAAAHAKRRTAPAPAPEKAAPRQVAQAEGPPPPPAPKKKASTDPFESGGGGDDFEKLLNEPPKRSVYVPPAPGAGPAADKVSPGQIQEAVAGKMAALRDCLAKQQAADPEAHGEVTATWDIEPDGRPSSVSTGRAQNQPFSQCLVGVVKSIRFPKSRQGNKGEDKVRFPFKY